MAKRASSVDQDEVARFERLSEQWWDPDGPMRPLHRINPLRIEWLRDRIAERVPGPEGARRDPARPLPLQDLSVLDIGCGAGLLSEPMRRLGARVVGIDPAERNVATARAHAAEVGLSIDYRAQSAEALAAAGERFDIVFAMEVIEHVAEPAHFVKTACSLVRPEGMIFFSTLNRTLKSFALGIVAAEFVLRWVPRGTHDWRKFVTPDELSAALARAGFACVASTGVIFDPLRASWRLSSDTAVNYMIAAAPRA